MQSGESTDRLFRTLLRLFVLSGVASAIAWALGWEYGWFGVLAAGAFSGIPLFHFAMHWPKRDRENSDSEGKKRKS